MLPINILLIAKRLSAVSDVEIPPVLPPNYDAVMTLNIGAGVHFFFHRIPVHFVIHVVPLRLMTNIQDVYGIEGCGYSQVLIQICVSH